jgi:exonuclease III
MRKARRPCPPGGSFIPGLLRVGTYNLGGRTGLLGAPANAGGPKLQAQLQLWRYRLKLDVVCLQETWLCKKDLQSQLTCLIAAGGYTAFWALATGDDKAGGVAILIRTELIDGGEVKITNVIHPYRPDPNGPLSGRVLAMDLDWGGHSLFLVNCYLPASNNATTRTNVITQCLQPLLESTRREAVVVGDWNFTDEWVVDRAVITKRKPPAAPMRSSSRVKARGPPPPDPAAGPCAGGGPTPSPTPAGRPVSRVAEEATARAMRHMCEARGLRDAYRHLHGTRRSYTYFHPTAASRLDRIYVTGPLIPHTHRCAPHAATLSDHRPVVLALRRCTASTTGPGRSIARLRFRADAELAQCSAPGWMGAAWLPRWLTQRPWWPGGQRSKLTSTPRSQSSTHTYGSATPGSWEHGRLPRPPSELPSTRPKPTARPRRSTRSPTLAASTTPHGLPRSRARSTRRRSPGSEWANGRAPSLLNS